MKVKVQPLQPRGSVKEWLRDVFGGVGRPHLTQYELATPRWPADYPELNVVFISDLHVGCPAVTLPRLEKLVERINALEPDVILLGGDYLSEEGGLNGPYVDPRDMAPVLGKLKSKFQNGVVGVLGNHDAHDKTGVLDAFRDNGIIMLENAAHQVGSPDQPIFIAGLADHLTGVIDLQKAFDAVGGRGPVVMVEHNPSAFDQIRQFPAKAVLTLSGHTHAWQVKGPGRQMLALPGGTPSHYAEGLIEVGGEYMLVSSGLGTSGLPLRVSCPAQIERIILKNG